jgi:hypothetical protein
MRVTSSHIPLAEIDRSLVEIDCFGSLHEYDSPAVSDPNAWPYAGAVRPSMAPSAELYGPEGTPPRTATEALARARLPKGDGSSSLGCRPSR